MSTTTTTPLKRCTCGAEPTLWQGSQFNDFRSRFGCKACGQMTMLYSGGTPAENETAARAAWNGLIERLEKGGSK